MKIAFIVNPIAGSGKAHASIPDIEKKMALSNHTDYEISVTKCPGDATELAKHACENGAAVVAAVGGDGTVLEVARALIGTDIAFAVIPVGSGNDFARSIRVPSDTFKAIDIILSGKTTRIDTMTRNGSSCINISSTGIDADVVKTTQRFKHKLLGKSVYLFSLIINIFTFKPFLAKVELDGKPISKHCLLIAICNGRYYGGGFQISPKSQVNDGYLDVVVIETLLRWKLFGFFPLVPKGKHVKLKQVQIHKAKNVVLHFKGTRVINVDGDLFEADSTLHYAICPSSLTVCVDEDFE